MRRTGPSATARSRTRVRQAVSPHDCTASRSPSSDQVNSVDHVRPNRPSAGIGSSTRDAGPDPSSDRRQTPRSARVVRSTRLSKTASPPGLIVARRMTSATSATAEVQPVATSIVNRRDATPSSAPTSRRRPNGPAANDSAGSPMTRADPRSWMPIDRRWPTNAPSASRVGSSRIHAPVPRSARVTALASRAAATLASAPPPQASGVHGRSRAASVDEPMATTAPNAMTPGPIARSHRCSAMSLTSPGGSRRRAEARPASSQPALIGRLSGSHPPVERAALEARCATLRAHYRPTPRGREAGAIPAQSRYGDRPLGGGSPVADPRCFARTFERKVGRTVRSTG